MTSPSIITCRDSIIKYSNTNIIFFENNNVYKQFPFNKFKWVNEIINVNALNHPNIIRFKKCEILDDFIVDPFNKEIHLDKKEKVVRITMDKYDTTLDRLNNFTDYEIIYIFGNILMANIYCNDKNILHRDIKEKNILINYKELDDQKRSINNVILADFNISKYRYDIKELSKYKIMTITHRPPEISYAILNNIRYNYDERIDVWSLCTLLSYLITGKSFYSFINDGYLKIFPDMIYDVNKLIISMIHFIKIYENKNLEYLNFYKKIIFMGIKSYESRSSFIDIYNILNRYIEKKNINIILFKQNNDISTPYTYNYRGINLKTSIISIIHNDLQNHDSVINYFYKFYNKMYYDKFNFTNISIVSLYILTALLLLDGNLSIDNYINIISFNVNDININREIVEMSIIKIMKFNNYLLF